MNDEEKQIKQLYRQVLQDEIDWDDLKKQKARFIRENFVPRKRFTFSHRHLTAPALSFCLVLGLFLVMMPEKTERPENGLVPIAPVQPEQTESLPPSVPAAETFQTDDAGGAKDYEPAAVSVSRLQSDVGTTMVYQRTIDNVPVVVIWVFPGK